MGLFEGSALCSIQMGVNTYIFISVKETKKQRNILILLVRENVEVYILPEMG